MACTARVSKKGTTATVDNHTGRQFSLAFKFRYFVNEKFAKFKFRLFLNFLKSLNDSLYD